nr:decapping nuclease dom-3-like [Penaeus vannamei]
MRGLLKKIMKTPYNPREPWTILVTGFKGTLYMVNWKPYSEDKEENEVPKNVGFWGHKFEQYMKAGRFLKPFIEGLVIKKYITHLR